MISTYTFFRKTKTGKKKTCCFLELPKKKMVLETGHFQRLCTLFVFIRLESYKKIKIVVDSQVYLYRLYQAPIKIVLTI